MRKCDFCLQTITPAEVQVNQRGNDFHEKCWEWMERQKRIHARKVATGATFELIPGDGQKEAL